MKLTKRHEGKTVKIQDAMLAGVLRRTWNKDAQIYMGAGGCELTFSVIQTPATIFCLGTNDKTRCLIHWPAADQSMWIDTDLLEKVN